MKTTQQPCSSTSTGPNTSKSVRPVMMPEPFDRDARELAKDAIAFYSRYANPLLLDALIDAARWAVKVTEGDGIWWCERHQCRWGYAPFCGWLQACPKSRRLLI